MKIKTCPICGSDAKLDDEWTEEGQYNCSDVSWKVFEVICSNKTCKCSKGIEFRYTI